MKTREGKKIAQIKPVEIRLTWKSKLSAELYSLCVVLGAFYPLRSARVGCLACNTGFANSSFS